MNTGGGFHLCLARLCGRRVLLDLAFNTSWELDDSGAYSSGVRTVRILP